MYMYIYVYVYVYVYIYIYISNDVSTLTPGEYNYLVKIRSKLLE